VAEGALERNLITYKFMHFYGIPRPFFTIRSLNRTLQMTAILKLLKLPACPLPIIAIQSQEDEEEKDLSLDFVFQL
jgi:hypothetical protein